MATPRRQPRPATEQDALRTKLATMTYSFAQQMPPLPTHTPPPPSANNHNGSADDPNFPQLTPAPLYSPNTSSAPVAPRAWEAPKKATTPARPPRWANGPGKTATVAEVVASNPPDNTAQSEEVAESEKHQAELALYSKLVPTTSAVPRNPGRSLGGGGLRATGSVAAQKSVRAASSGVVHVPQPLPALGRKEPMASRMRSLSSETSKPQLARRVAKPNRSASATPPLTSSVPSSASSNASADGTDSEMTVDEEFGKSRPGFTNADPKREDIPSAKVAMKENPRPSLRKDLPVSAGRRGESESHTRRVPGAMTRRLEEAFSNASRFENGRSQSPIAARKSQVNALRRSSTVSPPPGLSVSRSGASREAGGGAKASSQAPPGFESRSAAVTRASILTRGRNGKTESDPDFAPKVGDRDNPLMPPQNARADALREALNSRRNSNSPRPSTFRRNTHGESQTEGARPSSALPRSFASRKNSDSGGSQSQALPRDAHRPVSTPAKNTFGNAAKSPESLPLNGRPASLSFGQKSAHTALDGRNDCAVNKLHHGTIEQGYHRVLSSRPKTDEEMRTTSRIAGITPHIGHGQKPLKESSNSARQNIRSLTVGNISEANVHLTLGELEGMQAHAVADSRPEQIGKHRAFGISSVNGDLGYTEEEGWTGSPTDDDMKAVGVEALVDKLLGQDDDEFDPKVPPTSNISSERAGESSSTGLSMIDVMREFHANGSVSMPLANTERTEDVLLPPLPNSEDVGFESMLRSMGWTPLDDDEAPRHYQNSGFGAPIGMRQASSDHTGVSGGHAQGGTGQSDSQRAYYSHFQ